MLGARAPWGLGRTFGGRRWGCVESLPGSSRRASRWPCPSKASTRRRPRSRTSRTRRSSARAFARRSSGGLWRQTVVDRPAADRPTKQKGVRPRFPPRPMSDRRHGKRGL